MKPERTQEDAEKIRELMISLQIKVNAAKHHEVHSKVMGTKLFKSRITAIAVNNTSETFPVVKGRVEELLGMLYSA